MTENTETVVERLWARLELGAAPRRITGVMGPARSLVASAIAARHEGALLVIVPDERRLSPAVSDLSSFLHALDLDRPVYPFPAFALDPYRGLSPHLDVVTARLRALVALTRVAGGENAIVVATASALLYRTVEPRVLAATILRLHTGATFDPYELENHFVQSGYRFEDPVTSPGDFTRRGGILDVFPPGEPEPLRLEFMGDELEEIRTFDPQTQTSTRRLEEVRVLPASEWPVSHRHREEIVALTGEAPTSTAVGFLLPRLDDFQASVFDYLEPNDIVIAEEPTAVVRGAELEWERVLGSYGDAGEREVARYAEPSRLLMDSGELRGLLDRRAVRLQEMTILDEEGLHLGTQILTSYRGRVTEFLAEIRRQRDEGQRVHVFAAGEGMIERTVELLSEAGLSAGRRPAGEPVARGQVVLEAGSLTQSFVVPELELAVFTASDVFAEPPRPTGRKGVRLGSFLSDFRDLKVSDYVVHTEHGIGVFTGLKKLDSGEATEFVVLEYQGGDRLYVPVERLDLLEKYSSAEGKKPRVDKLGGGGWDRVKKRVKKSMREMAGELLRLYAARKASPGYAFSPDNDWMREFEGLFSFEETPDQFQAIADVKQDMEAPSPMDRLLCGDVGYGKTEVAMRAAFKALMDGKQVAVLVPTTVLAFQHENTFRERFAAFPARIEMLSRFKSRKEQKRIVENLGSGKLDVVIGTHRLLSKDVRFHDLGLLVVDEEQRFGVSHKERLKKLRHGIDCLTMTATPIPRTLHMSLSGIRDLSVIETPPKDRMAIQTHITRLESKVLAEAFRYELGRGGQIYFVHNRVSSIHSMANYLKRLVPEARIGVGHGQMREQELERVMLSFIRHEFDVLVSTTIIENGLDIPLVNTLVVNRADRFGLSQLYQLRGRVGRSNRRAYAYLLVPEDALLTPVATRRLAAIREFSELGAGFRVAALDLELRGAGNLLGGEQHGHMDAVGFDLYCRLLDETVRELEGEDVRPTHRANLNLRLSLRIPEDFIDDTSQRMTIYKRASSARDGETLERLQEETRDRYGPLPEGALQFFEFTRLQVSADELGLSAVERERGRLAFRLPGGLLEPEALVRVTESLDPGSALIAERGDVVLRVPLPGSSTPPEILSAVREVMSKLAPHVKASRPGALA